MSLIAATSIYWHLPILLVLVSLVYSGTRYDDWNQIVVEAGRWIVNMLTFLGGIALALWVLTWFL